MISKKTVKLVKSLHLKKYRKKTGMFLVEGAKSVHELLQSRFRVRTLIGTEVFLKGSSNIRASRPELEIWEADEKVLSSLSSFKNNSDAMAIAEIPEWPPLQVQAQEYALVLDDVRDPGNLGTIIRVADWYGIHTIICSVETTDVYNPKVIHASMGSFLRVRVYYADLSSILQGTPLPVYGTFPDGTDNVHAVHFAEGGLIVLGNESEGINPALKPYIKKQIYIPGYGKAESLNVAMAAAVVCDNMRRQAKK